MHDLHSSLSLKKKKRKTFQRFTQMPHSLLVYVSAGREIKILSINITELYFSK